MDLVKVDKVVLKRVLEIHSRADLARKLGVALSTIFYWLKTDGCRHPEAKAQVLRSLLNTPCLTCARIQGLLDNGR